MIADGNINKIKHDVLYEVAKLAFAGELEEKRDFLPEKMIPGTIPHFRCCVYKEREIIRQRIRLAEGKSAGPKDDGNIIQVIQAACADCPISSYVVTENCQNCLGKACVNACRFGAVHPGEKRSRIDPNKCKECGQCAKACPYNAIAHLKRPCKFSCPVDALTYDENGLSVIDEEKCIRCGACIHKCPFGAIGTISFITDVIAALQSSRPVYAMLAPATEGQFGADISMASWRKAAKEVGFTDLIEVGLGGDLTTSSEALEWLEAYEKGENKTTSCCPGFVNMIRKHFPEFEQLISTTVSPMCGVSRMIKAKDPEAITVFIGPCVAKKSEVVDQKIEGNADYVLAYSEIKALFRAKEVTLQPVEDTYQESSIYGKRYGNSGGVTDSVLEYLKELGHDEALSVCRANGAKDCKRALMMLKAGKLKEEFIEGMACEGGCVGGPSCQENNRKTKKDRDFLISKADQRSIKDNLSEVDLESFSMHR
ncbi:MAG: 4Fe-4S dicluster domain-containing protein [Eubacteriaceae bacterium]|nr:4Fe-4S dicluster domain-containing protein [Eubacteriaceae bacterium]